MFENSHQVASFFEECVSGATQLIIAKKIDASILLSLACTERLMNCYKAFCLVADRQEDLKIVRNYLNIAWGVISGTCEATPEQLGVMEEQCKGDVLDAATDCINLYTDSANKCIINLIYSIDAIASKDLSWLHICPQNVLEATTNYIDSVTFSNSSAYSSERRFLEMIYWATQSNLFFDEASFINNISKYLINSSSYNKEQVDYIRKTSREGGINPFKMKMLPQNFLS